MSSFLQHYDEEELEQAFERQLRWADDVEQKRVIPKEVVARHESHMAAGSTVNRDCYDDGDATILKVRCGPSYSREKRKRPSAPAYYELAAVDVLRGPHTNGFVESVLDFGVDLPQRSFMDSNVAKEKCSLPRVWIVNLKIPTQTPHFMSKNKDDAGVSLVLYFHLKPEVFARERDGEPALKLLKKFVDECLTTPDLKRRFKAIGLGLNLSDLGVPAMITRYNGKPVMLNKTASIKLVKGSENSSYSYEAIEIDVDVFSFNFMSRKGISMLLPKSEEIRALAAFVIQSEEDDELPECVLGCAALNGVCVK